MSHDYYNILEISTGCSIDAIKKAYKIQALRWHPDKHCQNKKEDAQARFIKISRAYEVLSNPTKRRIYDMYGEEGIEQERNNNTFSPNDQTASNQAEQLFKMFFNTSSGMFNGTPINVSFENVSTGPFNFGRDIFMSRMNCANSTHNQNINQNHNEKDPTIISELLIPMSEVYYGITKKIKLTKREYLPLSSNKNQNQNSNTSFRTLENDIEIKIEAGMNDLTRVSFNEMGDIYPDRTPGDLIFILKSATIEGFQRSGTRLIYKHKLSLVELISGFTLRVPLFDKTDQFLHEETISPLVNPQQHIVVSEKGYPYQDIRTRNNGRRDQLMIIFDTSHWPKISNVAQVPVSQLLNLSKQISDILSPFYKQ